MQPRGITKLVKVFAIAGLALGLLFLNREPRFQGETLRYWMEDYVVRPSSVHAPEVALYATHALEKIEATGK